MKTKSKSLLLTLSVLVFVCCMSLFAFTATVTPASAETVITPTANTEGIQTSSNVPTGYAGTSLKNLTANCLRYPFAETVDVSAFNSSKAVMEFWMFIPKGKTYTFGPSNAWYAENRWDTVWGGLKFSAHCGAVLTNDALTAINVQEGWNKVQLPLSALMGYANANINKINGISLWGDDVADMLLYGFTFKEVNAPAIAVIEYQALGAPKKVEAVMTTGVKEDMNVPTGEKGVSYKTSRSDEIFAAKFEDVNVSSWDMSKLVIDFWVYVHEGTTYVGTGNDGLYTTGGELRFNAHFGKDLATLSFIEGWNKVRIPLPSMSGYANYQTVTGLQLWGYTKGQTDMLVYGVTLQEVENPTFAILEQYAAEYKEKYPMTAVMTSGVENDNVPEGETGKSYATPRADHIMTVDFETVDIRDMNSAKAVMQLWMYIKEGDTFVANTSGDAFVTEWGVLQLNGYCGISFAGLEIKEGWNKVQIPLANVLAYANSHPTIPQIKGIQIFGGTDSGAPTLVYGITFAEVDDASLKVLAYQPIEKEPEVEEPTPERQETINLLATDGTLYEGMGYVWAADVQSNYYVEKAPKASTGKSLKNYTSWGSCFQGATIDISAFINPVISVWIYIDDVEDINITTEGTAFRIELDTYKYYYISLENCVSGWNKVVLAINDTIDTVTKFNLQVHSNNSDLNANVLIHNAQIVDYEGTAYGIVETEEKVEEPTPVTVKPAMINGIANDNVPEGETGKSYATSRNDNIMVVNFETVDISSMNKEKAVLQFWLYIAKGNTFTVTASGDAIATEWNKLYFSGHMGLDFTTLTIQEGWNKIQVPLAPAMNYNSATINQMKGLEFFGTGAGDLIYGITFAEVEDASLKVLAHQEAKEQVRQESIVLYGTDGNLISGASWQWTSYMTETTVKDFAPSASTGKSITAYTNWGNAIAFEEPIDISNFVNPAISAWIYVEKLDYIDNVNQRFAFEVVNYQYYHIDTTNFVRGWNKVIIPIGGTVANKLQIHVFANELYGYKPDYVLYHDIQIVDATQTGLVATEAATTDEPETPVPVEDFVLMNDKAELATGAEFGWGYLDDNGLVPVDIAPIADGYSMRLITGQPSLLINFPVSLLPNFQVGATAQFWVYIPDVTAITGEIRVEAKTYVYNTINIVNSMVAGWNKVSVPIQAFADDISKFNIVFGVNENYIPASVLIHEIRFVDGAKVGIIETKALPESATFDQTAVSLTVSNNVAEMPTITTAPENVKLIWNYVSSNTDVVDIIDGQLVAFSNGTATITAYIGELTTTLTVEVTGFKDAASITVENEDVYITDGSGDEYIEITVKDANGEEFNEYLVKYSSSNSLVAIVDEEGKIVPLSNGTAVITVMVGEASATVNVVVEDIEEGIAIQNVYGEVVLGGSYGWEGVYAGGGECLIVPYGMIGAGRFMNAAGGIDFTGFTLDISRLPKDNMIWDFWIYIPTGTNGWGNLQVDIMGGKKYYVIPAEDLVEGYNHIQIPIDLPKINLINRFSMFIAPTEESKIVEFAIYNVKLLAVENPVYAVVEQQLIPTSLTVEVENVTLTKEANTTNLPAITFAPTGALANVVFESSNKYIVNVENGKLVGYANGTVTITVALAMDESVYTTFTVEVSGFPEVESLIVTGGNDITLAPMERVTLEVKPDKEGANVTLSYKSSNPAVVLVSSNGTVTAVGEGTATITVKLEGSNVTTVINVTVVAEQEEPTESTNNAGGSCGASVGGMSIIFASLLFGAFVALKKKNR